MDTTASDRLFCIAEDRAGEMPGVCLLIASLLRHDPAARVRLIAPAIDAATRSWLAGYPQVELRTERVAGAQSWNVKPQVLLSALDDRHAEAVWLDSDMIVGGSLASVLDALPPDTLLMAEEALGGVGRRDEGRRAAGWSLPVGRRFPAVLNSCILRVTAAHRPLLEAWRVALGDAAYLAAQKLPWEARGVHHVGDQDVLTALLSSEAFAGIPVRQLRRGREIIQFYGLHGFTLAERARFAAGRPPLLVHAQGLKPWRQMRGVGVGDRRLAHLLLNVYQETSPYTALARAYRGVVPGGAGWMRPATRTGRTLVAAGLGSAALTGLPLAALFDALWMAKRWRGRSG